MPWRRAAVRARPVGVPGPDHGSRGEGKPWLAPDIGVRARRRPVSRRSVVAMGRILLIVAAVVLAFFLLGSILGFLVGLVKWALIIGLVAVVVTFVTRLLRSSGARR